MGAVKSFLIKNAAAAGSNFGSLQDGGTLTTATTGTGWTIGTYAGPTGSDMQYGVKLGSATGSGGPAQPVNGWANGFRSESALSGTFAAGTWTCAMSVIASAAAASGSGYLYFRIFKSTSATAATYTELTSGRIATGLWSNLLTSAAQNLSASVSLAQYSFTNEYLFCTVAIGMDTASSSASADVLFRVDQTNSKITTPSFSQAAAAAGINSPMFQTGQTRQVLKGGAAASGSVPTSYYQMRGWYAAGSTYETWVATGAPSTTPPSGHTLTGIVVVATWTA